ncbi:ABC transporter substrate binding protein [Labilibaculum sp.]|uniref:sensor histidine kinase n=1 Tax=Labilibaculum sp. TaxID=2060723 RepID=UPI003567990C
MKILKRYLPYLFLFSLFCLKGYSSERKEILVLNSYHDGLSWTDSVVNSIKRELSTNLSYSIHVEYMDSKRNYSQEYLQNLCDFYCKKYTNHQFDLIISTDNNAFNFLLECKEKIFGNVPVIFCGLNSIIDIPTGYSGVFENLNFCSTLELISKNHPDYKEIVIVSDQTTTGITLANAVLADIEHMNESIRYRLIQPENLTNLQNQLSALSKESIVLYLVYNRDSKGKYISYENGFIAVQPYCKVPIYSVWDFYMNHGAIGGALITGRSQGKQVSDMAKKVLSGTPIDQLESQLAEYEYYFDYEQLNKFSIKINKLPKNSRFINVPYSFVRENKEIVVLALTVLILLTVIIIVMTINIHLRKVRAQKEKTHFLEIKANHESLKLAKEAAEESSRLKSAFLANMSHEIRTPMNAILGFTDLLSNKDIKPEKQIRFISIIQQNTKSLLRLISDILDISKIETNQLMIVREKCNLNELFVTLSNNFTTIIEMHENKSLKFSISRPLNEQIVELHTDGMRLLQVFTNLIENAIKFTNSGEIEIGYEIKGKYLEFFVRDTGIGIPENKQKIIFDRFSQAELNVDTRKYGGTGLGLAISKSLVDLLGGQLWLTSKPGEGSTFYFTIPL